ncbi:MAG: RluA family pseudouridine synthase [Crocinitomicaceae bacterium]|nr:RluA family pseudouridine synthase [Crocinitomicaceae bacterium]
MTDEPREIDSDDDLFEHHRIVADRGQGMVRIDKFLVDRLEKTSRSRIQSAHDAGFVKVNGQPVKASYKVKPGDIITVELPYPIREIELIAENIPLEILYEDEDIVVINKQAGLVVHPGHGNYTGTLINGLLYHFEHLPKTIVTDASRPGLVHRLDKLTTGVMVVAKTEESLTHLAKQFFNRTIERRYVALVWGDVAQDGTITGNTGRSTRDRKIFTVFPDGSQGKHAVTHYKVLERLGYITLVECRLETGRTHQIRVHMKYIGHPLFGDPEYGGNKILKGTTFSRYKQFVENCFEILPRQALHARSLAFTHPSTKEWMSFEMNLPEDMRTVITRWKEYTKDR